MYHFGHLSSGHFIFTRPSMRGSEVIFRSQKGLEKTYLKNAKVKH